MIIKEPFTAELAIGELQARLRNQLPKPVARCPSMMWLEVTPTLAKMMLALNLNNRRKNLKRVELLVRAMRNDQWFTQGDSIRFDTNWNLLDGQKRLTAIVESGRSQWLLVAWDIATAAARSVDRVEPRSCANDLEREHPEFFVGNDKVQSKDLATAISWLYKTRTGQFSRGPDGSEQEDLIQRYPQIVASLRKARGVRSFASAPAVAFVHCMASTVDRAKADQWLECMIEGVNLQAGSPVAVLRKRLINAKLSKNKKDKLTHMCMVAVLIKCWRHFQAGNTIKYLRWRERGPSAELFPTFDGEVSADLQDEDN